MIGSSLVVPALHEPEKRSKKWWAIIAIGVTILAWASAFPVAKIALHDLSAMHLATIRFAIAALPVAGWIILMRPVAPRRHDFGRILLCGLLGIALYNLFLNTGQLSVSAGSASLIIGTTPIITALCAAAFLGERLGFIGWLGAAVSASGIALIATDEPSGLHFGSGASFVLAAAICQATYFILQRPLIPRYGAMTCTAYTLIAGALLLLPWLPGAVASLIGKELARATIWSIAELAIIPTLVGYAAWNYALDHFGAARAATALFLVPPTTIPLAYLLTAELPRPLTIMGGCFAILGVILTHRRRSVPNSRSTIAMKIPKGDDDN